MKRRQHKLITIFDFGSQTCHLIGRRLRDLGIEVNILDPETPLDRVKELKPAGIIFSGGPASVYGKDIPSIDLRIFKLGIPILGICYGWQLTAHLFCGKVKSGLKEYGPGKLKIKKLKLEILDGVPRTSTVWLSHGDTVIKLPKGFEILASSKDVKAAFVADLKKEIYGVQFHPEVEHTQYGRKILANFAQKICGLKIKRRKILVTKIIQEIKEKVGNYKVVGAVSGGTESTIAASLCIKAIGKNFIPVYVNSRLMRQGTQEFVKKIFGQFGVRLKIIEANRVFLKKLNGVTDPEKKRMIIGHLYYYFIRKEIEKIKEVKFFLQGTVYSDVIESKGTVKADKIKSHHNVGGLPKELDLQLLEPLREFYTDEVWEIGRQLRLPEEIIYKQPFPGPGQAIRIMGEVTEERLGKQNQADQIVLEELKKAGWLEKVFQSFPVLTGVKSTAVKGDSRFFGEVIAVRAYTSKDRMTADWAKIPYEILGKISTRIVNEVPGVSRVVYDITTKPPATMEWE